MSKNHVKGFVAALVAVATLVGGQKAVTFVEKVSKVVSAVEQLSQVVAEDQKSGQKFTVADVLTELAATRIQEKVAAQQQKAPQPSK